MGEAIGLETLSEKDTLGVDVGDLVGIVSNNREGVGDTDTFATPDISGEEELV